MMNKGIKVLSWDISAVVLGIVFILSSIFKWIGLKTFAITIDGFCTFLGYDMLYGHGLILAVVVCTGEMILGIAALVPRTRKYAMWLMLPVMMYFTYITYLNMMDMYGQIESCGCFGEVIHLTPSESFYKNIVLLTIMVMGCAVDICLRREMQRNDAAK